MTIDVYLIPASPPCRAVLMAAKYLDIPVNHKIVDLRAQEHLKPEFLKMNPQHCVPTIDDDGFILWESRTILTYLVNKYAPNSPLYPECPQQRAIIDRMLYFDNGTLYKATLDFLRPQYFQGLPADPEKEKVLKNAIQTFEDHLKKNSYAAGNSLTLADISIYAGLGFTEVTDYSLGSYPKISEWLQKMKREIPGDNEINVEPLRQFKEFIKTWRS